MKKFKNLISILKNILYTRQESTLFVKKVSSPHLSSKRKKYIAGIIVNVLCLIAIFTVFKQPVSDILSPLAQWNKVGDVSEKKAGYEVFGFAPYWNIKRLDNVDFSVLTTFAYFGIPVKATGELDTDDYGYTVFMSKQAERIFEKARNHGTRVVVTLTLMNNEDIRVLMDDVKAQDKTIKETVKLVSKKNLDGVNVDFEYIGDPGKEYQHALTNFVDRLTKALHKQNSKSSVTVSVYASSMKSPKIYDVPRLAAVADGIFMMAYDYATKNTDTAMPTAPLYGYKSGTYWYDVATAVEDFLHVMPADKLILGVPWYGYNYAVSAPKVAAAVNPGYYTYYWYKRRQYSQFNAYPSIAQTYTIAKNHIQESNTSIVDITSGWDEEGQVGWKAYKENGVWRMIFIEDERSLSLKYNFAKDKKLRGVGMWALGFDNGTQEMWSLLQKSFGSRFARNNP